eukprot:5750922-Alexandrium_andersonii.AAC.1
MGRNRAAGSGAMRHPSAHSTVGETNDARASVAAAVSCKQAPWQSALVVREQIAGRRTGVSSALRGM